MRQHTLQLIIASKNVHKIREFKTILSKQPHIDLMSLLDFPDYVPPKETGKSFMQNAILKAEHAAKALNHWVISDDSGLVVPALNGAPGVFSSRYAGENASDKDNRIKLLQQMQNLAEEDRNAYFHCVIALASPDSLIKCFEGSCEGTIISQERGGSGFGYDPLFIKNSYNKTFAELEDSIKNRISHRRKALDKLILHLETLFR